MAAEAKRLIDLSFTGCVSLDQLAKTLEISPRTLRDLFKQALGVSPIQYLTSLRIAEAKRLIDLGRPIKQIPAEVGFFDQSHLTRHFKRATGKTPAEYGIQQNQHRR